VRPNPFSTLGLALIALTFAVAYPAAAADKQPATKSTTKPAKPNDPLAAITDKQIQEITYDDLPPDQGFVTPLAENLDNLDDDSQKRLAEWTDKLNAWAGARDENAAQRVRNLLAVASLSDLGRGEFEAETAYVIFEKLRGEVDKDVLIRACAWIVLKPEEGKTPTKVPELGWEEELDETMVRERVPLYAKKFLGKLLGKIK
jgi:hypothetical protein